MEFRDFVDAVDLRLQETIGPGIDCVRGDARAEWQRGVASAHLAAAGTTHVTIGLRVAHEALGPTLTVSMDELGVTETVDVVGEHVSRPWPAMTAASRTGLAQ